MAQANEDGDEDEESGKTATFPFLNRLFGGNNNPPAEKGETPQRETGKESRKGEKKHKYLDNYCINLSRRAREGKLDRRHRPGGGDPAGGADSEPPAEEQSLPHR